MKSTGIVRKIDVLGRIVLPIEQRRILEIGDRDSLEIFIEDNMLILKKYCSVVFVSVMGGMFHNLGQLLVAAAVLETVGLMAYLPVLLLCGLGAGCAIGVVGGILTKRIQSILEKT